MKNKSEIENATVEQLQQWYRNATATVGGCGGHTKARENKGYAKRYADELTRRGATVPPEYIDGQFNGEGSW